MSSSSASSSGSQQQQASSLAQLAAHYRLFLLENPLSEPQELAYDPARGLIYVAQRCLQGHATAPVEYAAHVSVFDATPGSPTSGTFVAAINLAPYAGPHALELDPTGAYLFLDVEHDGHGGKGTITVDLSTYGVVSYAAATVRQTPPAPDPNGEFIAEVCLQRGRVQRRIAVPATGRTEMSNAGTGRHINFSAPGTRFVAQGNNRGQHVLDASDPVVALLRRVLSARSIYILSKNVLLV